MAFFGKTTGTGTGTAVNTTNHEFPGTNKK